VSSPPCGCIDLEETPASREQKSRLEPGEQACGRNFFLFFGSFRYASSSCKAFSWRSEMTSMGLWDILTKDLTPSRADLRWREPWLYRIRLRGDLAARVLLALSGWLTAAGVLLLLFSVSQKPGGLDLAFGLGAAAGLGPLTLFLFFTKQMVSGNVKIIDGMLQRRTQYSGFSAQWSKTACWDLGLVDPYQLLTAERSGHNYHLLLLEVGDDCELIGIPANVDLPKLVALLASHGSRVVHTAAVPPRYTKPIPLAWATAVLSTAVVIFTAGAAALFG
jgi:hypothetical protein